MFLNPDVFSAVMSNECRDEQISVLVNQESLQEERIQALFQLMNIADSKSLDAICRCLKEDECEIVRHEAAFVLGETAAYEIIENLKDAARGDVSGIVRHEAILALGTIANKEVLPFLEEMMASPVKLVSESAKIAKQRIEVVPKPYRGPDYFNE